MGINTLVYVRDWSMVNFDKLAKLASQLAYVEKVDLEGLTFIVGDKEPDGPFISLEGHPFEREYWKHGARSMTEMYALEHALGESGTEEEMDRVVVKSHVAGLVPLCQALAENHGKAGKSGGQLYRVGSIPHAARNLAVLPEFAYQIAWHVVAAVTRALAKPQPLESLKEEAQSTVWKRINVDLANAERMVYNRANVLVTKLYLGEPLQDARRFPLVGVPTEVPPAEGIEVVTRSVNLVKHMWAALRNIDEVFRVATIVVIHPESGRIAVLTSSKEDVDVRPIAAALSERFPGAQFDVNFERGIMVWDPSFSSKPGPDAAAMVEMVSRHRKVAVRDPVHVSTPSLSVAFSDAFKRQGSQKRR